MPTQNVVHVDEMLSNVAVAAFQDNSNFIAGKVFPDVPVSKQSDQYAVIPAGDFNRDEMQRRADATESSGSDFTLSTDTYFCDVYAHHHDYGEQARANADSIFQLESNITRFLTNKALIKKEKIFAANFFAAGKWDNAFSPTIKWEAVGGTPIKDIKNAVTRQGLVTGGFYPNVAVMTRPFLDAILDTDDVLNRVLQSGGGVGGVADPTVENLRQLLNLDEILIMQAVENTAPREYVADADGSGRKVPKEVNRLFVDTNSMLLLYKTSTPGNMVPSAGYTFSWSGLTGQAGMGTRMLSYDKPLTAGGRRVEIEMAFSMKMQASHFGTYFSSCFTADPLDLAGNSQDGEYTIKGSV